MEKKNQEMKATFPQYYSTGVLTEAAQMELEFSHNLLPSAMRSKIVAQHLWAIRKLFPRMDDIHSREEWEIGQLIITPNRKCINHCINLIEISEYGPLNNVQDAGFGSYIFKFEKPYNPEVLSPLIEDLCEGGVQPDFSYGDGNNVKINILNDMLSKYTFSEGKGDSLSGCAYKHFWQYSVAPIRGDQFDVKLIREWERGKEKMQ